MTATSPRSNASRSPTVMHRGVVTCSPTTSLVTVAREMAAHRIHCVVVRRHDTDPVWGVVSTSTSSPPASLGAVDGTPARQRRRPL